MRHSGRCACWGTIEEFLSLDRGRFMRTMKESNASLSEYEVGRSHYLAWRDEFRHLRVQLAKLGADYKRLVA